MSVSLEEAASVYPSSGELNEERAEGGASKTVVLREANGGNFGEISNLSQLFDRSLVYPDPALNHRAREAVIWNSVFRSTFQNSQLPIFPANLVILSNVGVMKYLCIDISLPANTHQNVTLPRGWGIYMIDHVEFIAGGTTVQMFGQQIAQWYFHVAKSQEQLDRMFSLAGAASGDVWAAGGAVAQVLLPMPWCVPDSWCLDTSLLQANNISVNVYLNSVTTVAGGADAGLLSNTIASGRFYARTGQYSNPARDSVLGELAAFSNVGGDQLIQSNIFQQWTYFPLISVACAGPGVDTLVNLQGFDLSRRLKGICLTFIQTAYISPGAGGIANPGVYEEVTNLQLIFQGRQVFNTLSTEELLLEALQFSERAQVLSSTLTTGVYPYTIATNASKIYRLMFTLEDYDNIIESGLPGVQSLQLQFQTGTATNYNIYASYLYDRNLAFTGTGVEIS